VFCDSQSEALILILMLSIGCRYTCDRQMRLKSVLSWFYIRREAIASVLRQPIGNVNFKIKLKYKKIKACIHSRFLFQDHLKYYNILSNILRC